MIFIGLYLLYSIILLSLAGLLTARLLKNVSAVQSSTETWGFSSYLILGIVGLTATLSYVSLFSPINSEVHLIILLCLFIYAIIERNFILNACKLSFSKLKDNKMLLVVGMACVGAGIVYASGPVKVYDTGLYHAQTVKWINEYGVVPGLGNLHYRLAFNSSWLIFSSFFDILAFDGKSYHLVNLIAFVVGLAICLRGFANILANKITISNIIRCAFVLFFYARYKEIASLSSDFPVTTFLLYILVLVVEVIEKKAEDGADVSQTEGMTISHLLIVILSLFMLTIKLSSVPVLLFPLFVFFKTKNISLRSLAVSLLPGTAVFIPFVIRNLILSGYVVFPFPAIDIFHFDWKIPHEDAFFVKQQTRYWAIRPEADYMSVPQMTFLEWFPNWFEVRILENINFAVYLFLTPLLLIPMTYICLTQKKYANRINILLFQGILTCGVLFWLFTAPDPRLGAGWILGFGIFPIAVLLHYAFEFQRRRLPGYKPAAIAVMVIFCLWFVRTSGVRSRLIGEDSYLIWTIEELPRASLSVVETHEGFHVYVPEEGNQAWDGALPGTPYVNYDLELRGESIKEGFRVKRQWLEPLLGSPRS